MIIIHPLLTTLFWISVIYLISEQFYKEYKQVKTKKLKTDNLKKRIGKLNPELSTKIKDRVNHISI